MIYNPQEEFDSKFRSLHQENTERYLQELVTRSGVDIEENRRTVQQHHELRESLKKLRRRLNLWRVLRVLMCITLLLIPLVILRITPKIRAMREEISSVDRRAEELMSLAYQQMKPLNLLFTDRDSASLIEQTIPDVVFAPWLSQEQAEDMRLHYDYPTEINAEQSTEDLLAGHYNENPFVFERRLIHSMGSETYHGYLTIRWTETYRGSDGKTHTRTKTQTLHASVTKPKPFYHSQVLLSYCAQGAPELSFSRDASHLDQKSEKEIDRYVKKGEKRLKKMTDEALRENRDFTQMSNSDFEVLFDALNRTDEVQFRSLFTPLAQTNMVDLIRSRTGYGDDFDFIKRRRTNRIVSKHSQGRPVLLTASEYVSYSYDLIRESFIGKNVSFFKMVYFDFAPIWAIPAYQERPVHSLKPMPEAGQRYALEEMEALANRADARHFVHPQTQTPAILKSAYVKTKNGVDEIRVSAHSYDKIPRVDHVPVFGGDGRLHDVMVPWDEYIPLEATNRFFVAADGDEEREDVLARRNGLCIFQ